MLTESLQQIYQIIKQRYGQLLNHNNRITVIMILIVHILLIIYISLELITLLTMENRNLNTLSNGVDDLLSKRYGNQLFDFDVLLANLFVFTFIIFIAITTATAQYQLIFSTNSFFIFQFIRFTIT